ncbi:ABC transporter substrate-binding protein [Fervidobacterium islandicum]|uniref:ABC transporter substrate-binding protein n=1 Tax=Fervidobacterium islandicum TaxID=2423 RepID=UPI003A628D3D
MRRLGTFFLLLVVVSLSLAAVTLPREETVYIAGALWGPATTWNLYAAQSTWGTDQFLFLPAFQYDLGRDAWIPVIAEKYEFVNSTTVRIYIRKEAKWSDGRDITSEDFMYTFQLTKELGIGPGAGWENYIDSINRIGAKVVEFKAKTKPLNYFQFLSYALGAQPMPKHVYEGLKVKKINIGDWVNDKPSEQVVSGPYKLYFYTPDIVVYQRIDNWWGKDIFGLPRPKYIAHVIYKDNPAATLAIERGDVDWAGLFIPSVWEMWQKKNLPVGTWYKSKPYFLPDGVGFVYLNNTKPGLADPAVRKAIAYAIPYDDMLEKAYFGYGSQAHPSFVIDLFEPNKQYINYDLWKKTFGTADGRPEYDLDKAKKILDEAGYKVGKDGIRVGPDGKRLSYTISVPYGWTDWMMMCELIAKSLKQIGIEVTTEFPDFSVWADRMTKGTFDMIISWSVGPSFDHPFNIYRFVLDKRLSAPVGEVTWAGDWERYDNDEIVKLLDTAVSTLDPTVRKNAYFRIQEIIAKDMPSIPAFYTAHWYEYSTKYWVNWPNQDRPYWFRPAPWHADVWPVLFGISSVKNPQPIPKWLETTDKGGIEIPTSKIFKDLQSAKK